MSTRHPPKPPPAADDFSDPVVNDFDQLQLVVAGPGAGKTALFKRVLSARPAESNLAITFINNLVKDLEKALEGLASVNTFHGYANSLLHQLGVDGLTPAFDYCPRATEILCSETCWLLGTPVSHDQLIRAFHDLDGAEELATTYIQCANYYNVVSHDDAIYRVVTYLNDHPSEGTRSKPDSRR
jgi:superfamily I DNA/RNA helicase